MSGSSGADFIKLTTNTNNTLTTYKYNYPMWMSFLNNFSTTGSTSILGLTVGSSVNYSDCTFEGTTGMITLKVTKSLGVSEMYIYYGKSVKVG